MKTSLLCFAVLVLYLEGAQSLPNLPGLDPNNIFGLKTVVHLVKSVFDTGIDILRPADKNYNNNVLIIHSEPGDDYTQLDEKVFFKDNNKRNGDHDNNLKYNPIAQILEQPFKSSPLRHVIEKVTSNIEPLKRTLLKPDRKEENFDKKLSVENFNIKNEQSNFDINEKLQRENVEVDSESEKEIIYEENRSGNSRSNLQQYKKENNKDFFIEEVSRKELKIDDRRIDINDNKRIGKEYRPTLEMSGKSNEDDHHKYNNLGKELSRKYTSTTRKPFRHIHQHTPSPTVKKLVRSDDRLIDQTKLESSDTEIFEETKTVGEYEQNFDFNETLIEDVMEEDVVESVDEHQIYNRNMENNPINRPIVSRKKIQPALDDRRSIARDEDKSDVRKSQIHYIYKDDDSKNHNREVILKAPVYILLERPFFPETELKNKNLRILPGRRLTPRYTPWLYRTQ